MSYIEATDTSLRKTGQIKLHGPSSFAGMRKAGALVAKCLDELTDLVKPGVPTSKIDDFVREFAFGHGAYPATLMYRGYRYSTCTSINHVVCHGMPGDRALKEGDIVNIDVTFIVDGWYGDSSRMYAIAPIARKAERLIEVTYEAMMRHHRRHRPCDPELRRAAGHERGARFLRPWPRPAVPRRAEHHPYRPSG
jgi:methionyl aminopeptidase